MAKTVRLLGAKKLTAETQWGRSEGSQIVQNCVKSCRRDGKGRKSRIALFALLATVG